MCKSDSSQRPIPATLGGKEGLGRHAHQSPPDGKGFQTYSHLGALGVFILPGVLRVSWISALIPFLILGSLALPPIAGTRELPIAFIRLSLGAGPLSRDLAFFSCLCLWWVLGRSESAHLPPAVQDLMLRAWGGVYAPQETERVFFSSAPAAASLHLCVPSPGDFSSLQWKVAFVSPEAAAPSLASPLQETLSPVSVAHMHCSAHKWFADTLCLWISKDFFWPTCTWPLTIRI